MTPEREAEMRLVADELISINYGATMAIQECLDTLASQRAEIERLRTLARTVRERYNAFALAVSALDEAVWGTGRQPEK
jgi:hypothetical protein